MVDTLSESNLDAKKDSVPAYNSDFQKTPQYEAMINIRHALMKYTRNYFDNKQWTEVTVSSLTPLTGTCEIVESLFRVPYLGRTAHLSQTGQLQLEYLVKTLKKNVWTFTHSFRAEPRVDARHLTEFTMVEPEAPDFKLADIMHLQEELITGAIKYVLDNNRKDLEILNADIKYLEEVKAPFNKLTYSEAVDLLNKKGIKTEIGDDLNSIREKAILAHFDNQPTFITKYPSSLKFFNMKRSEDGEFAYSVDLLAPPFGEISGGAEREEDPERLKTNLLNSPMLADAKRLGLTVEDFDWYLELWESTDIVPRGGCGIGFERLVGFIIGIPDITYCTEFPRNSEHLFP